ncbi:unnamed protein product, partial [Ixodes hexagonus]
AYSVRYCSSHRGKFATVRRCVHRESGRDYAAKYIRKRRRASDVRHEILHEALLLKLAQPCPRVVDFQPVFCAPLFNRTDIVLAAGGELQHVLDSEECLPEKDVVRLMRQILEAVQFLHDRNIAHLDIKPQNLLLTSAFPQGDILLCDFGISRVIGKGTEIREIVGTPDYVAPEVLQFEPISLATDIWSLGVLTYVLLSGHSPFGGDTKQETFCNITAGSLDFPEDLFGHVSSAAKDFVRRLIVRDASKRLSVKDGLNHPWLATNKLPSLPSLPSPKLTCQVQSSPSDSPAFSCSASSDSSASDDSDEAPMCKPPPIPSPIRFYDENEDDDDDLIQPPPLPLSPPPKSPASSPLKVILKDCTNGTANGIGGNQRKQTSTIQINVTPRFKRQMLVDRQMLTTMTTVERRSASVRQVQEVESMVVGLDGLSINGKRILFTDEILVDERVGIVY